MLPVYCILAFVPCILCDIPQWDIFTFSQEWPPTVCVQGEEEHHKCKIPQQVKGWGIHGLWPTKRGSEGPTSCNSTWPFEEKSIQSILQDLEKYWPNMYSDTSLYSFWQHEWTKHGTCATSLAATSNELKYFSTALKIGHKYNAGMLLNKQGIVPTNNTYYKYDDYVNGLATELGGIKPVIQCGYDQHSKKHIIYEIEICLNKQDFSVVSCYGNGTDKRLSEMHKRKESLKYEENLKFSRLIEVLQKRSHKHHHGGIQSDCPKSEPIYYLPIPGVGSESLVG